MKTIILNGEDYEYKRMYQCTVTDAELSLEVSDWCGRIVSNETYARVQNGMVAGCIVWEELWKPLAIERAIFNDPATIVIWNDGTKTVVKCQDGDEYDPEKGLALCCMKKMFGNKGKFNDVMRELVKGE